MQRITTIVLAVVIAAAASLAHAVEIPDTPAGRVLSAFLGAYNSGNRAKLQAYIDAYHRQSTAQDFLDLREGWGELTVLKIEKSEPNYVSAIVGMAKSDDVLRTEYRTDPADPMKIVFGQSAGIDRPDEFAIPRLSQEAALSALNTRVEAQAAEDKFMGVVLVERRGTILVEKAWGYGDRGARTPLALTDKFRLGSMNKMFTAVAVLQLVAQGKVSLDGTVGQYLRDYPNRDIADKVTIRMLLTHTGGTGEIFGDEFDKRRLELRTLADYVKLYGARAPEFTPGSQTAYSNYGFILLGMIVQTVSGEDYYDYVQSHIFAPAGMTDTGSLPESVSVPGRVTGYMEKDGKWVSAADTLPWRGTSAGGGHSTARDLLRFAHAMMDGTLLPPALRDAATRSQTRDDWYGYGFEVGGKGAARRYGHTGGAPGMTAELRVYPEAKTVVIALSNMNTAANPVSFYGNRMPLTP